MAVYCELDHMVAHLRHKTESFYETLRRDAIAEQLYSAEGDPEVYFSRSLEKEPPRRELLPQHNDQPQHSSLNKHQDPSPKKKYKAVTFEKCTDVTHMYQFAKEPVGKIPPASAVSSSLTKSIKPTEVAEAGLPDGGCVSKTGGMVLTVHTWVPSQPPITIRVIEKAIVGHIVAAVLNQYIAQKREPAPIMDLKAYFLRIADESGKADEDYPALDEKQLIYKFKDEHFVLCKNAKYQEKPSAAPPPPGKEPLVIKVNLPGQTSTKVVARPDMKIGELLSLVSKKRHIDENEHFIRLPYAEAPCDVNMTMEQVDAQELTLSNKSLLRQDEEGNGNVVKKPLIEEIKIFHRKSTNAPPVVEEEEPKEIFWYDNLAFAFKSFEVIKIPKKYGKKETTLGVDRDSIAHMSQQKRDSTKSKSRKISDVTRVALLEKPKQFIVEYSDGKSYTYESKTVADSREIVGKIEYLVKTEQNIHKT